MEGITVFTPSYNRKSYLDILYKSLLKQKGIEFEWLIVDDGSTDLTREYVKELQAKKEIDITYIYQENAGKHVAFNNGVLNAKYELFVCIDSDDFLVDNALERIWDLWNSVKDSEENMCGLLAHRGKSINETMFGEKFLNPYKWSTVKEEMKKGFFETTMVHKTEILKKYPFPFFEGEKFITEDVVWRKIDQKYVYYVVPEIWTICSYLEDGLTKTTNIFDYPKGEAEYFKVRYNTEHRIDKQLLEYAKYLVFESKKFSGFKGTILFLPAFLLATVYKIVWKKRYA